MSFSGKVVIITGASSGIGADAALQLSKLGASVAIVGRNAERLGATAKKIRESGSSSVLEIVADVNNDAERVITATVGKFGKLDVLVNNAGILEFNGGELLGTLDTFDRIMSTNVRSVLALTKLAVPHLERTKGNVVNISSIAGLRAVPFALSYAMSKAALDHFTKCAAVELASKGIRVNSVNPGAVETPIFKTAGLDDNKVDEFMKECERSYPVGRTGRVEDISRAIAFLANDDAGFITGHILVVDGGKVLVK